ncbi:MAG: secondary thiamine-phosphate synthase enzyme YjbQ [Halanaerobiales bacterium]|jgi:secondary thiamine-phosphate synthase enzyme|nr:secondary thiamine-phosphate synthase enzyme YjbQ [Bacillota bacterium]HOA40897.1 secondary thiamine-phosphate synthase enzyme YjbQ [Halanaerobiales bacterium]HPZ62835.1 secondary thiamine-phosphate synthase enzyme YjbQ [Halanaerobiales bacterium]HQD04640.1 secondary thiamine-phosphate synthase enzyme YjbQ [Halanaerobiales bacterium]
MVKKINIHTNNRTEFIDITKEVRQMVKESGISDGIITIFIPHSTAAVTINENADPDVVRDIIMEINKVIPFLDSYKHFEGNSAAHIKSSLFGVSESVIVADGELLLGTWQGIYFCEFDGPRNRKVFVKISAG